MERIHYIIGIIVFIVFTCASAADQALTRDERVVALTLLGEARGEKSIGMYAVGCVIQQRAIERKLTPAQICLQRKQFSVWNNKKESDLHYLWEKKKHPKFKYAVSYARELARHICRGEKLDRKEIVGNANHYHTKSVKPYWSKGKKPTKQIGNHLFFKLP